MTMVHIFNSPGTFNVTVAVSDMQYNVTKQITVKVNAAVQLRNLPVISCSTLWWHDSSTFSCSQKQFCG